MNRRARKLGEEDNGGEKKAQRLDAATRTNRGGSSPQGKIRQADQVSVVGSCSDHLYHRKAFLVQGKRAATRGGGGKEGATPPVRTYEEGIRSKFRPKPGVHSTLMNEVRNPGRMDCRFRTRENNPASPRRET